MKKQLLISLAAIPLLFSSCATPNYKALTSKVDGTISRDFSKDEPIQVLLTSAEELPIDDLRCKILNPRQIIVKYPREISKGPYTNLESYVNTYSFTLNPEEFGSSNNITNWSVWYLEKDRGPLKKNLLEFIGGIGKLILIENNMGSCLERKDLDVSVFYRK